MNKSDEELNQLLNSSPPVPASPNLAQRIIAEAKVQSELKVPVEYEETFIKQFLHTLIFPKPAYALACSMLVGVLLGWQNPEFNMNILPVMDVDNDLSSLFLAEVNFDE
ncbi:MAG: hypothetical protein V7765_02310 [Oleispira sp.]